MNYNYAILKNILQTSILSDVLDELGIDGMLSSTFQPNFFEAKIFGKAKTLKVEKIKEGQNPNDIYKGLDLFCTIEKGDIIVVSNDIKELAYWGELNSNLAIRSGASGTIVDSVTRDNYQTKSLGYPVFSKGKYAKDIKNRGIVTGENVPIEIDGIKIKPGDWIFGDIDGIIVIPSEVSNEVISKAIITIENEKSIINDIAKGLDIKKIIKQYGNF